MVHNDQREDGGRIPIQLLVDYKSKNGTYLFDFCRDIGRGGVFIETNQPQKIDSEIEVTFTIPDSKETIVAKGKVIWVQEPIPGRTDVTPGMGVQFVNFTEENKSLLDSFVERYSMRKSA